MASHTPNYDTKIQAILDATKPGERVCALTGEKWMMNEEEIGWYRKFNVSPHPWSPMARLKHLMGFPSGVAIWRKPHAETGEQILSFVHPESPFKVITDREWFNREFAQEKKRLDPAKPFFNQFREFAYSIPVGALRDDGSNVNCVGVDIIHSQDCYMFFGGYGNKRCFNSTVSYESEDSGLLTNSTSIRQSYMINACADLHGCRYCFQNGKLINCTFCFACDNLENCFGATNKRYKKYLFWNEQLSKEEWERRVAQIDLSDQAVWDEQVGRFHRSVTEDAYWPPNFILEPLEDCRGEYMLTSTRLHDCYWQHNGLDLYRCWVGVEGRDSAYAVWIGWGDSAYLCADLANYHNVKMCTRCWRSQELEYCMDCYDCENCFGCIGLRKKRFHIFNKTYQEKEYWEVVDRIKCAMLERGEYGLFFPSDFSMCGYQFSQGELYVGYTDAELAQFEAPIFDPTVGSVVKGEDSIRSSELPTRLDDIDENKHVGRPILDETTVRLFTISKQEFLFDKNHRLPPPRQHFLTRITEMFRHSNTPIPEITTCVKCGEGVSTWRNKLFSGKRRVLCRPCYLRYLEEHG